MTSADVIYYRGLSLDRAGEARKSQAWLDQQWQHADCRVLLLHNDLNLMHWNRDQGLAPLAISHARNEIDALVCENQTVFFLGLENETPLFAADVSGFETSQLQTTLGIHEFINLREAGWLLKAQDAALLAYARGLLYWNRHSLFCSSCGAPAQSRQGGHLRLCSNADCAKMHFPRTDPAVIMLVEDCSGTGPARCLLARNARFPARMMSTLAGFVDPSESLEETVAREVFEEVGIRVDRIAYQASQPWPFPNSLMLGFRARATTTEILIDGIEIEEADWFSAKSLKSFGEWGDAGTGYCLPRKDSIARFLIESWIAESERR